VLGSVPQAREGRLRILVGGSPRAFDRSRALLTALGEPVYLGPAGRASALKTVVNAAVAPMVALLAESLALADSFGLEEEMVLDELSRSRIGSLVERKRPAIRSGVFGADSRLSLFAKDMRLVVESGRASGLGMRMAAAALVLAEAAEAQGFGSQDYSVLVRHSRMAGRRRLRLAGAPPDEGGEAARPWRIAEGGHLEHGELAKLLPPRQFAQQRPLVIAGPGVQPCRQIEHAAPGPQQLGTWLDVDDLHRLSAQQGFHRGRHMPRQLLDDMVGEQHLVVQPGQDRRLRTQQVKTASLDVQPEMICLRGDAANRRLGRIIARQVPVPGQCQREHVLSGAAADLGDRHRRPVMSAEDRSELAGPPPEERVRGQPVRHEIKQGVQPSRAVGGQPGGFRQGGGGEPSSLGLYSRPALVVLRERDLLCARPALAGKRSASVTSHSGGHLTETAQRMARPP